MSSTFFTFKNILAPCPIVDWLNKTKTTLIFISYSLLVHNLLRGLERNQFLGCVYNPTFFIINWYSCKTFGVDSIAVSLFTNSKTAATTIWERLQNSQRTLNQWSDGWTGCFFFDRLALPRMSIIGPHKESHSGEQSHWSTQTGPTNRSFARNLMEIRFRQAINDSDLNFWTFLAWYECNHGCRI